MTAVSVLDDRTAAAIRDAMAAARTGRIADACRIGEQALATGGDPAALNAMLGSLQSHAGNLDAAIRHLRAAYSARPADPIIARNLASALAERGEHREALGILTEELARGDATMQLERLRAFVAQMAGDLPAAIASYERVVAAVPSDWESWNNLGNARRLAEDFEGSLAATRRAVELNPTSPPVRLNFATALGQAGQVQEAEQQLRKMSEDFPNDSKPLRELHALLKEQGRDEEALEAIEAAVKREPTEIELWLAAASQRLQQMKTEAAEEAYYHAVKLNPSHPLANLGLAVVFELTNRTDELSELVGEAEKRGVAHEALSFIRAFDHRRAKRFAEGLAAMDEVPDELETARRYHLLGQLLEGVGRYDEAFDAFTRMNEIQGNHPTLPYERAKGYREQIRGQRDQITPEWAAKWRDESGRDDRPAPVFLVGFPRSGTTLLDTMLMGHPGIEILEEEPALGRAIRRLPDVAELPAASDEQIQEARDEYFRAAAELTPLAPGKLLIDKNPLSMNGVPWMRRLFPDARIILAVRHPCDVVLSCYVTNFKTNDGMASFLRLDTTAELYAVSFEYFESAQQLLDVPVHRVTYENVVADAESELRSLLQFLEIDWRDEVLDHQSTALGRGRIKTASYAQVAQPIYQQSAGRWQNYRKHLEPLLPVLEPWVTKFGYTL